MRYRGNLSGRYDPLTGNYIAPPAPWQRFRFNWEMDGVFRLQSVLIAIGAVFLAWHFF